MTLYSKLRNFQKEVVNNNLELIQKAFLGDSKKFGRQTTVAPTGSGKTFMMAAIIESGLKIPQEPNFIWLTHNKQILFQTQNEIVKNLGNHVVTVDKIEQGIESINGRVLLFNVQKGMSKKTKNWLEKWSKFQKKSNKPVIFIVDEADEGMSGKNMQSLREIFNPELEIGFTASFVKKEDEYEYMKVPYKDVIDAEILVEEIFYEASEEVTRSEIIERAISQRDLLETVANNLKMENPERFFIPKMLIQAPAKDCEEVARELQKTLNLNKEEFKKQVIVHTQNSRGLDELDDIFNVRYIIGDLMVERGWNCPEAYVLLSTKETVSKSKGIQLLGRVMRLPQTRRFEQEFNLLNKGYVYIAGKHSIEETCRNFASELPVLPPPKEIVRVIKRDDLKIPKIITFIDKLKKEIEDPSLIPITDNICKALDELRQRCNHNTPKIRTGKLNLSESSVSINPNESVEVDWNIELVKRTLSNALTKFIPRDFANLVVIKYQIFLKSSGGLNSIAPFVKEMSNLIENSRLIKDITLNLEYIYKAYEWPPFKLIAAQPHPLHFENSLYPNMHLNNEETRFATYLENLCIKNKINWIRNDISNVKVVKGHSPDFIVFSGNKYLFIEFKGKHLLSSHDSIIKNEAGQAASAYFMVYEEDKTGNYFVKGLTDSRNELFSELMIMLILN